MPLTPTLTPTLTLTLTLTRTPTLTLTRCDLEFKGRRLQLRPALEELRTEFYREIKKFISIPTGFKGLGYFEEGAAGKHKVLKISRDPDHDPSPSPSPNPNPAPGLGPYPNFNPSPSPDQVLKIFRDMPDRCLRSLQVVYEKASALFASP